MRVANSVSDIQYNIQQSAQSVQTALEQLSTGKRVNQISDDPTASANMVQSLAASANVDRYSTNVSSVTSKLQSIDSNLSSVVTALNQAITLGTAGANGTNSAANRQSIAAEVQGVLTTVVDLSNATYQGSYLYGGTNSTQQPFTVDSSAASGYAYNGNSSVNTVQVGDSLSVNTNLPGDQVFTSGADVLGSLTKLVSALQSGDTTAIGKATQAITTALNYVSQQRIPLDNNITQLNAQTTYLQQETVTLTSQQNSLVGIDTATAATNVSQAETRQSAVFAAAAKVLPQSLLQYLQ